MLPIGGSISHETSVCQPSPLARGESLSAWMIISSGLAGLVTARPGGCAGRRTAGRTPGAGPGVRCWSRKKITKFSASARWISSSVLVAERLRQIDPADLGADDRRQLVDRDRVIGRRLIGEVLVTGSLVRTNRVHRALLRFLPIPYHI